MADLPEHLDPREARSVDDGQQRNRDGDTQAGERSEQHHAHRADDGGDEVGPADPAVPAQRLHVHEAPDGGDDDRHEDGTREVCEEPREGDEDDDDQPRRGEAGDLAPATGLCRGRRLRQASRHAEPAREAGGDVRRAHADKFALGLDAITPRVANRRVAASPSAKATSASDTPPTATVPRSARGTVGRLNGGSPAGTSPTVATPLAPSSSSLDTTTPSTSVANPHGTRGARRPPPTNTTRARPPVMAVRTSVWSRRWIVRTSTPIRSPGWLGDPKQGWHLADDDRERQTEHEAGHDRLRQKLRDPTETQQADHQQSEPRHDSERGGDRHRLLRIATGEVGDERPDTIATDDAGPTINCGDEPRAAYASNARGTAYNPTCTGTPAMRA